MSVLPSVFLENAESMALSAGNDEVTQRNILSRAYYACYHRAIEKIPVDHSSNARDTGMHRFYFDQLMGGSAGGIERKVGARLRSMYGRRILADYRLLENLSIDSVALQLNSARLIFQILEH